MVKFHYISSRLTRSASTSALLVPLRKSTCDQSALLSKISPVHENHTTSHLLCLSLAVSRCMCLCFVYVLYVTCMSQHTCLSSVCMFVLLISVIVCYYYYHCFLFFSLSSPSCLFATCFKPHHFRNRPMCFRYTIMLFLLGWQSTACPGTIVEN